jgi:hypothetical protein
MISAAALEKLAKQHGFKGGVDKDAHEEMNNFLFTQAEEAITAAALACIQRNEKEIGVCDLERFRGRLWSK